MADEQNPYQEGKRAGAHPLVVVLGVILGLWLLIAIFVPSSKQKPIQGAVPEAAPTSVITDPEAASVMFKVHTAVSDVNAIGLLVPPQATDSQIVGLLKRLRIARLSDTLANLQIPATTPGNRLGNHAIADLYVFSESRYASAEAVRTLARGAHVPGNLYPQAIPFEEAMEHVRGHYRIDLNDTGSPDSGALGFADDSGVHSKHYRKIF